MFVKPKPGLKVRDPETRGFLPAEGREVPPSIYWARRVRDGDVMEVKPVSAASDPPAPVPSTDQPASAKESAK